MIVANDEGLVSVSLVDDTRLVLVPRSEVRGTMARVSPDGRFVAYVAPGKKGVGRGQEDIYLAALDGTWKGPLVEAEGGQEAPIWTPDGRMLIYTSDRRENVHSWVGSFVSDLWAIDVDHGRAVGEPRLLVKGPRSGLWLHARHMTPDGRLIVSLIGKQDDIYAVKIDPETHELEGQPWSVAGGTGLPRRAGIISPDGASMAFATRGVISHATSWTPAIRNLAAGTDRSLDIPADIGSDFYMPPMWSPDGRYLLYTMRYGTGGLYLFDLMNDEQGWLVPGEEGLRVGGFGWLPEGHSVVYGKARSVDDGEALSVRRHDVDTEIDRELWQGTVGNFFTWSNHMSPDGRYVSLARKMAPDGRALWILDLELGEMREFARSASAHHSLTEPFWSLHEWTGDGTEIITSALDNSWAVNARPAETALWTFPLAGGEPRKLGSVYVEYGDEWFGSRYFSLYPNSDTLTFTAGGAVQEIWMIRDFGQVLQRPRGRSGSSTAPQQRSASGLSE